MKVAELVCKTDLIIWDEAPMMHRRAFETVDRTLRDLMQLDDTHCRNHTLAKCGGEAQHLEKVRIWSPPGLLNV
jgi:hypothetical protein